MALFIWLDINRYKTYLPLFISGKCIGLFLLLGWLIVSRQVTMMGSLFKTAMYVELVLLSGDLLALTAVLLIKRDSQNAAGELMKSEPAVITQGEEN
ncbi:MAG: hypothetical protein FWB77_06120 [Treponema sp.]|nr:hypothetical protein [Treponema sp.]